MTKIMSVPKNSFLLSYEHQTLSVGVLFPKHSHARINSMQQK